MTVDVGFKSPTSYQITVDYNLITWYCRLHHTQTDNVGTMNTKFILSGSTVRTMTLNEDTAFDELPPNVYAVRYDDLSGFYLDVLNDQLSVPKKIYGHSMLRVEKCIKTYIDRSAATGILLTGDKGSGKSLFMSLLANEVITSLELPVVIVQDSYAGDKFQSFLESLGECCLVFDEFGKMYDVSTRGDAVSQDDLLSVMDGINKTKRLIILTENSTWDISDFMLNRPGRIYYHFKYGKLEEDSILEYCNEFNINENTTNEILEISRQSGSFSFDILQTIIEEYVRFESPVTELIEELNIDLRPKNILLNVISLTNTLTNEVVQVVKSDMLLDKPSNGGERRHLHDPGIDIMYTDSSSVNEDDTRYAYFNADDLIYEHNSKLTYKNNKGLELVAKAVEISYNKLAY